MTLYGYDTQDSRKSIYCKVDKLLPAGAEELWENCGLETLTIQHWILENILITLKDFFTQELLLISVLYIIMSLQVFQIKNSHQFQRKSLAFNCKQDFQLLI